MEPMRDGRFSWPAMRANAAAESATPKSEQAMRIGVQMDPIQEIAIQGDTSFALLLEAQARGFETWWFLPQDVFWDRGLVRAHARQIKLMDRQGAHFVELAQETLDLGHFDVVLIRQDPPFDIGYVANTYLLDLAAGDTLIVNRPSGVRNIPEKLSILAFDDLIAPTFVGRNVAAIQAFAADFDEVVLKPAFLSGGTGVVRASAKDASFVPRVQAMLTELGKEPLVVQEFLPAVTAGDKRIMVLDGQAVAALRRVPKAGEFRANIHVGGRAEASELTARDLEIVARVAPLLHAEGIVFAGLDIIDGRLTEINVTSPTLVRELQRLTGIDVPALFWDKVQARRAVRV